MKRARMPWLMGAFLCASPAFLWAADLGSASPAAAVKAEETQPSAQPEPRAKPLLEQDYLTGDWGGDRTRLADQGVAFGVNYINEVFGNPMGGIRQGTAFDARLELTFDLDFAKLAGLNGASFHANAYYIFGDNLSASNLDSFQSVTNIEAYNTFRLYDLWYQQEFFDGKVSLRLGQIAADDEFIISSYGATFVNGTFGWLPFTASNLPNGGPGYPLPTPGIRLKIDPIPQLCLMAAVFNGSPADIPGNEDPQKLDNRGTEIDFNQGALTMFEADYMINQERESKGLPGTYKLGGFYDTENFADLSRDNKGLSLADPASSGSPRQHSGDWGIYFVADQMIWRKPPAAPAASPDARAIQEAANDPGNCNDDGLGVFWRIGGTPSNRNFIDFYTDGGLSYEGLLPGRTADILGLAVGYAQVSSDLQTLERESNAFSGTNAPVQDDEMVIELTYQAALAPWWTVQPDIQYIVHPGGHIADPNSGSGRAIPDALVLGLRSTINF